MEQYNDSVKLKEYLQENYLKDDKNSILVKDGWRAWGYLQTLYHRNIYCTALYTLKLSEATTHIGESAFAGCKKSGMPNFASQCAVTALIVCKRIFIDFRVNF